MLFHIQAKAGILFTASLLLSCLFTGCSRTTTQSKAALAASKATAVPTPVPSPTLPPKIVSSSVAGLVATLEDETSDLTNGQVAWTTYWKLCWNAYPGAQGYELETRTGEGASRHPRRQADACLRLEVAKGQNDKAKGFFNRELMLASISGQVAYRVRAVLDGNRVTEWSPLMEAGRVDHWPPAASPSPKKRSPDSSR